ncbi:ImmA/IrrE family metallo-endopeptidase [Brevundimonas sp.]|uniref:ImmA/IrrE family metallo-endopeptidase n=1 Tax=Brevundimonas sp. TaxID=1871086 RepID=UPI003D0A3A7E
MARKEQARQKARELVARFGVQSVPVPIDRIARGLGVTVQYAPFDGELSGMAFIKDGKPMIGINSLHTASRQRFTLAHELAHHILHREKLETDGVHVDKGILRRDSLTSEGTDESEIEANNFAAELLMPEGLLDVVLGGRNVDLEDEEAVAAAARKFRVSSTALQFRLQRS